MAHTDRTEKAMKQNAVKQLREKPDIDPVEKLRLLCLERGANGIQGLGRSFRIIDADNSRTLDFLEFRKGLRDFGLIDITNEDARQVFNTFDKSGDGKVDFDEVDSRIRRMSFVTRISRSQRTMVLLGIRKSCVSACCLYVTDERWIFSPVPSPMELKIGRYLRMESQISGLQFCLHFTNKCN
jgi:hypothetical protein